MMRLLETMGGWLAFLERGPVLLQLLLVLGLPLLMVLIQPTLARRGWHRLKSRALALAAQALAMVLLVVLGLPYGLVGLGLAALAAWMALDGLHDVLLARGVPAPQVHELDTRLLKPLLLLLVGLGLVGQLDNLQDLALISLRDLLGVPVNLGQLASSVLILYLLSMGSGPPAIWLAWVLQRGLGFTDGSRRAVALMIRYVVVGVGILWALDHIGFNRTAILTVAGGLSVGLGFGIKEVFSNFVSGIWLLFEGSVRPGEVLFIDGDPCEVRSLGLRAATLWRDRDNAELVIPNQTFFTATTTSFTRTDRMRRCQVQVGVAYRHDPREVVALLEGVAQGVERVLANPAPRATVLSFGEMSITYGLAFWVANPMTGGGVGSELRTAIWECFREHGIEIPLPPLGDPGP